MTPRSLLSALLLSLLLACAAYASDKLEALEKAAWQGDAQAQFNLGIMYDNGEGIPEDDVQAVHWYRKAAEQGLDLAQFRLGAMYAHGKGIPKDYVQAFAWNSIAAAQGDESAKKSKEFLRGLMTQTQTTKAQELSREYWEAYGPAARTDRLPGT